MNDVLDELYAVALERRANPQEGSYTCYLFEQGLDKILKKSRRGKRRNHHRRKKRCESGHRRRNFRFAVSLGCDDGKRRNYP